MRTTIQPSRDHHYYFVTGKLAQVAVREVVQQLANRYGFQYTIGVMPITVAALMTPRWLQRHLDVPSDATHVILPGYCQSGIEALTESLTIPVILGPKDCRDLATLWGAGGEKIELNQYDIEIIAEINHAPRRSINEIVVEAQALIAQGADIIDFGCDPAGPCSNLADYIKALRDANIRVSIDTFDPGEVSLATRHGAELVLSVNSKNRQAAADWGCEVVVIPDSPDDQPSLHASIEYLLSRNVAVRMDPILEPIGIGFTKSLVRYAETRTRFPDLPMMMGIGNLTELTDVDSAGVNFLLLGICQELRIQSVLTTQVINWARSSVAECDIARRMVHFSQVRGIPPKRLSEQLVMLRDPALRPFSPEMLQSLSSAIRDNNYRLFAQDDLIHLISAGLHLTQSDPFLLFEQLMETEQSKNVDPSHAFYLGFEMAKASIALLLGKQYEQDNSLQWGHLTRAESNHRLKR